MTTGESKQAKNGPNPDPLTGMVWTVNIKLEYIPPGQQKGLQKKKTEKG